MTPFQLLQTPLGDGTSLIQASAGTGKTHTIAGVFLRLLIESAAAGRAINVDEILVVTYTEAATEELRDRIRRLLARAAADFAAGCSDDTFIAGLLEQHAAQRESLRDQLTLALNCFDLAPIFTIHGFCQRALKDRAFESGALFDAEVLPDQSTLLREIADDYWRRNFYDATPLRVAVALQHGLSPAEFLRLLWSCLNHPGLKLLARAGEKSSTTVAAELEAAFEALRKSWRKERASVEVEFDDAGEWGNQPYNVPARVTAAFAAADALLQGDAVESGRLGTVLKFFSASFIAEKRNKKRSNARQPAHGLFNQCDQFIELEKDFVTTLQRDFVNFARAELRARKEKLKLLSYDDLLTRLRDALRAPGGTALAAQLRAKYRVALIDEFQDTDPVQCEIFQTVFARADVRRLASTGGKDQSLLTSAATRPSLFLIGDPKQAIYGFRGADIFTYMSAAQQAERSFTLEENWRSESGLVHAVNTLFGRAEEPFIFEPIQFHRVKARGAANDSPLEIDGRREPPLKVWFCPRDKKPLAKGRAEELLARATAAEIARLLNGNTTIGGRALLPEHIAVLTMTHQQAALVQEALRELRVPSVQQTLDSVFASYEAVQMFRLLAGIAAPWNHELVRAALATDLLGHAGSDLAAADATAWSECLALVRGWFELWVERGFTAMFRHLLDGQGVRARLLALPDGERALTNVLHLAEALHEAALREKLGATGLVQWLATRMEEENPAEEHQLRLERDVNSVQLVTVHKSKGLQYEVVFVPFCWRDSELKRRNDSEDEQEVLFHDSSGELVRDLGPGFAPAHVELAKRERLAENVRLLYVALTRAKHRCCFAWGAIGGAETSAPARLLHGGARWPLEFAELSDARMLGDLRELADASRDDAGRVTIAVSELPTGPADIYRPKSAAPPELRCREFHGHVPRDIRVTSFSGLAAGQRDEEPDHDPAEPTLTPVTVAATAGGIFAFPRGSRSGTFLHQIFEELDFTQVATPALDELTSRLLREHGFTAGHAPDVCAAVRATLNVPLDHSLRPVASEPFCLAQIPAAARLNELEFCFPLCKLAVADLREVFARHGRADVQGDFPEQLGRLTFAPLRGFMKGFIDLVFDQGGRFWLVDWKSNHLGNRPEDYSPESLRREMSARLYVLQYHLYVVALDLWLRLRVPGYDYERHFGGVFYLFLRGIDPKRPELGVFRDRPEPRLVKALGDVLFDSEQA